MQADADEPAVESLRSSLLATLPRFCEEGEKLGEAFARGDWQPSLETLTRYLAELEEVMSAFIQVAALAGGTPAGSMNKVPALLSQLSDPIRRRSWVEVSDLLLYELVPLIEEWQRSTTCEQE